MPGNDASVYGDAAVWKQDYFVQDEFANDKFVLLFGIQEYPVLFKIYRKKQVCPICFMIY